eukprot:IDg23466t1
MVYVNRENHADTDESGIKRHHKLQPKALGPFKVIAETSHTVTIDRDGLNEVISRDRAARAPTQLPKDGKSGEEPTEDQEGQPEESTKDQVGHPAPDIQTRPLARRTRPPSQYRPHRPDSQDTEDTNTKYVADRIVNYDKDDMTFRVRWEGYTPEEDTWEPAGHLPYNLVAKFFKRTKGKVPPGIRNLCIP